MSDVSRETSRPEVVTAPSTPEQAGRVFPSERLALAEAYARLLASDGVVRGLIGPREAPRLWDRHLLNCAVLGELLPEGAAVADIGSGAGLPGLVLAISRPDLQITLIEPLLRRTTFLQEVVDQLELDNVEVVRGRAEEVHGKRTFDVVTSRAVAPLERLLTWSMPLVSPVGALVAMKGSSIEDEIRESAPVLTRYKCSVPEVFTLGENLVESPTCAVRVAWADPTSIGWPLPGGSTRKTGKKRRKP